MKVRDIKQRVVITGMGALTSLGLSVEETWSGLVAGRSGIAKITHFDPDFMPIRIAGEVKGFDPTDYTPRKEARRMSRASQLALGSGTQAMADAGLGDQVPDPERSGIILGTGIGGFDEGLKGWDTFQEKGLRRVNPFKAMAMLCNLPAL